MLFILVVFVKSNLKENGIYNDITVVKNLVKKSSQIFQNLPIYPKPIPKYPKKTQNIPHDEEEKMSELPDVETKGAEVEVVEDFNFNAKITTLKKLELYEGKII